MKIKNLAQLKQALNDQFDILKEITVDVNKNNKNAIISVNDYNDNQFNDLDEFDSMLTIMQIIKQYCTK